jgi:hypothetical protein
LPDSWLTNGGEVVVEFLVGEVGVTFYGTDENFTSEWLKANNQSSMNKLVQ